MWWPKIATHRSHIEICAVISFDAVGENRGMVNMLMHDVGKNGIFRLFVRVGSWRGGGVLKAWFTCGVVFGLVAAMLSVLLLLLMVYNTVTQKDVEQQVRI